MNTPNITKEMRREFLRGLLDELEEAERTEDYPGYVGDPQEWILLKHVRIASMVLEIGLHAVGHDIHGHIESICKVGERCLALSDLSTYTSPDIPSVMGQLRGLYDFIGEGLTDIVKGRAMIDQHSTQH
jgi:hypothetical protein